jgi:hypothetical protein
VPENWRSCEQRWHRAHTCHTPIEKELPIASSFKPHGALEEVRGHAKNGTDHTLDEPRSEPATTRARARRLTSSACLGNQRLPCPKRALTSLNCTARQISWTEGQAERPSLLSIRQHPGRIKHPQISRYSPRNKATGKQQLRGRPEVVAFMANTKINEKAHCKQNCPATGELGNTGARLQRTQPGTRFSMQLPATRQNLPS